MDVISLEKFNEAITSIKGSIEIAKLLWEMKGTSKNNPEVAALQASLIKAQSSVLEIQKEYKSLIASKAALEQQVVQLKDWSEEKKNYKLLQVSWGVYVYTYTQSVNATDDRHCLCHACFNDNKKSILTIESQPAGEVGRCSRCNATYAGMARQTLGQARLVK